MAESTYYTRTAADWVKYMSAHFPCVLLTGARQVGKSTLLEEVLPAGMNYVTLDDYTLAADARRDPIGFLREHEAPLLIDEVQYAPELFRAIKMRVDAAKRNGMYWMTGSQHFQLMEGVSESLAGRVGIIDLYSMSQRECMGLGEKAPLFSPDTLAEYAAGATACDIHELYRRIWRGGYPVLSKDAGLEPRVLFESYVRTYLERDVNQLTQVENRAAFLKLMRSAAARTGQQLVYSDLARDAEVSPNTAKAWISIMETTGIISLLYPYSTNSIKRLTKTPKLYFMDTGLCSWLAGWHDSVSLMNSPFAGAILETFVYGQLMRSFCHNGIRP
ncbi:MAG: ATP-binding protein, partial [Akkermansia sp.]|nr:ATP-binding protein [Akkermansia sp.]